MRKLLLILLTVGLYSSSMLFAQQADTTATSDEGFKWDEANSTQQKDEKVTKKKKKSKARLFVWGDEEFNFSVPKSPIGEYPYMALDYGVSEKKNNTLSDKFNRTGMVGLKIGNQELRLINEDYNIVEVDRGYVSFGLYSKEVREDMEIGNLEGKLTHIGFGWDEGYGYGNKTVALIFNNNYGMGWSKLLVEKGSINNVADAALLDRLHGAFRFSYKTESAVTFQPIPFLTINAAAEKMTVFPRMLFWKTSGAIVSELICHGLVSSFTDRVLKSTPFAAPILNFILQSGVSYGFSELRKDEANFPFGGEKPLTMDTYKIGFTMAF